MTQRSRERRRGDAFSLRLTPAERARLDELRRDSPGPRGLGPWIVWRALEGMPAPALPVRTSAAELVPVGERLILDLCAGSGSWSRPYASAGYRVLSCTLPDADVRTMPQLGPVWGVLAAPPCDQFSLARNGHPNLPRDIRGGLEVVSACLRLIVASRPRWWALENPVGMLGRFLGAPRDTWDPCDFGDPWTKRTALWGEFSLPKRGPFVAPLGSGPFCALCDPERRNLAWCNVAAHRAVTPPGFARRFFEANP